MKKIFLILSIHVFHSNLLNAQDIMVDRKGNDVLLYYSAGEKQFKISSGDPSLQISYTHPFRTTRYYIDKNNNRKLEANEDTTVIKSSAISFSGKILSTDDYLFLSDLGNFKPGFKLEIGYQRTIDTIVNLYALPRKKWAKAYGVQGFIKMDNTNIYDSILKRESQLKPITIGITAHMSFIKKRWVLPSLSITLEKSWNEDDLIKYQHNKPSYSDAQVIGLDDFVGFIGVKENIGNLRIRLSAPLTPFNYKGWSNFCIAPYYVYRQTFSSSSSQIFGFSLNYFSEGITGRRYNYTDAFGIGFDWERMAGKKVEPKFFIYGTLNIGKILKVKDDD